MKKSLFLFTLLILISQYGISQFPFTVEISSSTYVPLDMNLSTHLTDFDENTYWDDPEFTAQIGFLFPIDGLTIQSITQDDVGASWLDESNAWETAMIEFPAVDFIDRGIVGSSSLIHWLTTGEEGSRIFTLEYKDVGFYSESDFQSMPSFMNFQMILHESTGEIEFHFGSSNISGPDPEDFEWYNVVQFNFSENPMSPDYDFEYGVNMVSEEWWSCPTGDCMDDYYDLFGLDIDLEDMGINQVSPPYDGTIWRFIPSPSYIIDSSNSTVSKRYLQKTTDALGREVNHKTNQILFNIYSDGSVDKKFFVE